MKGKIDLGLHPVDDLFENDESRTDKKRERLLDIPIADISDFPDHPYKVKDDKSMTELVESIRNCGVIQSVIVREKDDGGYEMVSGHKRKHACELAGIETIPCRVQDLTRDDAVISMVDSNLQREEILPSEKAKAYRMRLDALKRQGQRTDLTCASLEHKSDISRPISLDKNNHQIHLGQAGIPWSYCIGQDHLRELQNKETPRRNLGRADVLSEHP